MDARLKIAVTLFYIIHSLGTEGSVVLNHVPLAGALTENIANLNDNDDNTCVDLPEGTQAPWTFKVKMDTVPSNQLVKVVPDGMPCSYEDLYVMVNATQDDLAGTAYNKCNLVAVNTAGSKDECHFNCGTETSDKFTFMQVFKAQTGWKVCDIFYAV